MASDLCAGQEAARPQPLRRDQPVAARWSRALAAVVVYVAVAALVLGRVPWADNNVLALAHWAVTSGHFSLLVRVLDHPKGFNLLADASFPSSGCSPAP